jgi:hypothetical protein
MAGVKGNKNAVGNKGGGRKSAYQEMQDASEAFKMFFDEANQEELEAKIQSGKFSLADRFKLTGMEGDTNVLVTTFKKVVPDLAKLEHTGKDGGTIEVEGVTIRVRKE